MASFRFHYTYYSYEEFGRGYIGMRSCNYIPANDITYFGSFVDKTFKPTQKIILEVHNSAEEAAEAEKALHSFYDVAHNPHFANRHNARTQFNREGVTHTEESKRKIAKWKPGRVPGRTGKKHTEESKRRIAETLRGRKFSKETREKISENQKKAYKEGRHNFNK